MTPTAELKPRVCARKACGKPATHMVRLRLRPPRRHGDGEMKAFLDLVVCPDHAATIAVKDVVSDDGWAMILQAADQARKIRPERGRTAADAVPIDQAPPMFRDRYEPTPCPPAPPIPE